MQKLVHKKVKQENSRIPGKLKEFEKNSRNLRKTHAFSEKTQENGQQTQGFANSTWFLLPKNVQKSLVSILQPQFGFCIISNPILAVYSTAITKKYYYIKSYYKVLFFTVKYLLIA